MRLLARTVVAILVVATTVLVMSGPAAAHASLITSNPASNAILDDAPNEIRLGFSEPIDATLSEVLITVDGTELDPAGLAVASDDSSALVATMPTGLTAGVAIVRWRVLSTADGHLTQGILVFGIGAGADPTSASFEAVSSGADPVDAVVRWLDLTALVLVLGGLWTALLLAGGGVAGTAESVRQVGRSLSLSRAAGLGGLAVGGLAVVAQLRTLGGGSAEIGATTIARRLLFGSRWGALWWIQMVALVALVGIAVVARRHVASGRTSWRSPAIRAGLVAGATLIGAQALGSHAAGLSSYRSLSILADSAHLMTAAVWAGGLIALLYATLPALRSGGMSAIVEPWARYGPPALIAAALLLASGLFAAARYTTSLDAMLRSAYGRWLIVKIVLTVAMVVLGARNSSLVRDQVTRVRRRIDRAFRPSAPRPSTTRPVLLAAEAGVALVVLFAAGFLTASPTANGPEFTPSSELGPDTRAAESADILVGLSVKPNRPGQNLLSVQASSTRRPPPGEIDRVLVRMRFEDDDRALETVELEQVGVGTWELLDPTLSSPGRWTLEVVVRRAGLEDRTTGFEWVLPAVAPSERLISDARWGSFLVAVATLLILFVLVTSVFALSRVRRSSPVAKGAGA